MPEEVTGTDQQATPAVSGQQAEQPTQQAAPAAQEIQSQPSAEAAELQQRLARAEASAKHFQAEFTRSRQQIAALSGVAPQADPLAEDIQAFVKQGYSPEDARAFVEYTNRKLEPILRQNQQLQQSQQAMGNMGHVHQAAMQADPELFSDPRISQYVGEQLQQAALQGQLDLLTPEYARMMAVHQWGSLNQPWKQQAAPVRQAPAQMPQRAPQFGFNGPSGGYSAVPIRPQSQGPQVDPGADAYVKQQINSFGGKK